MAAGYTGKRNIIIEAELWDEIRAAAVKASVKAGRHVSYSEFIRACVRACLKSGVEIKVKGE